MNVCPQGPLWYTTDPSPPIPDDPSKPLPFDRVTHVQSLFFDIFADHSAEPPSLDYTNMVGWLQTEQPTIRSSPLRAYSRWNNLSVKFLVTMT